MDTNAIYQYNAKHYKLSAGQRQERLDHLFIVFKYRGALLHHKKWYI